MHKFTLRYASNSIPILSPMLFITIPMYVYSPSMHYSSCGEITYSIIGNCATELYR